MRQFLFLLAICFVFSCKNSPSSLEQEISVNQTYYFEKLDSIIVKDVIARVFLFQGQNDDKYIFRDLASSEVYFFDQEGALVDKWNKEGDVPGKFSMSSSNLSFDKDGDLVIVDIMTGIKVLKKNSDVVQDFGIYQNQVSLGSRFSLFDTQQVIEKDGREYLLYSLDIIEEYTQTYDPKFLAARKNLLMTDLETNETQKFISFPEGSQFLNGKVYFFRDLRPVFHYDESKKHLYLMFQSEPILYTYDWSGESPELIETQKIDLEGFEMYEGFEVGSVGMGQIGSYQIRPFPSDIVNISKYGEDLVISYIPTPQDKLAIAKVTEGIATDETKKLLREQVQMRTILLKPNGKIIKIELPDMYYASFKVDGDKVYWMKKPDPNVESEEFTLYWGEIKLEEGRP